VVAASALAGAVVFGFGLGSEREQRLVLREAAGDVVARLDLPADGRFALEYRNSIYGVAAEERFRAARDGSFRVTSVASDLVAVLEEYYGESGRAARSSPGVRHEWRQEIDRPLRFTELRIIATALGRRVVIVGRRRIELGRLVPSGAVVTLTVERGQ
jgi:hypothetical protein